MMLTELADVLRAAGLRVVEVPGWRTRSNDGNRFAGVRAIICHWTATPPHVGGDYPSLNIVTHGRSDLPGALSQLGLGRDGTWYVIAAGVAWHAGVVDRPDHDNWHAIGIEAEYHPDQGPWPAVQERSYERGVAALRVHYGVPLSEVQGHYEVARPLGRKTDPNTLPGGMSGFRQRVAAVDLEDDMSWDEVLTNDEDFSAPASAFLTYTNKAVNQQGAKLDTLLRTLVGEGQRPLIQQHVDFIINTLGAQVAGLSAAVSKLAVLVGQQDGADQAEIEAAVAKAIRENTLRVDIDVSGTDDNATPTT
jgi:hypothetical protein